MVHYSNSSLGGALKSPGKNGLFGIDFRQSRESNSSRNQSGNQTNLTENYLHVACISTTAVLDRSSMQFYNLPPQPVGGRTPECALHLFIHKGTAERRAGGTIAATLPYARTPTQLPTYTGEADDTTPQPPILVASKYGPVSTARARRQPCPSCMI